MKHQPIITCFDDQDAYKFFMQNAVLIHYPGAWARYTFILRDPAVKFPPGFGEALKEQVRMFEDIRCTEEIVDHMTRKIPWLDNSYMEYLREYRFDPSEVIINQNGDQLKITIKGPWHKTILWEVPLMACISELFFHSRGIPDYLDLNIPRWEKKFATFSSMNIAVIEFGTRRRKSKLVQEKAIEAFLRTAPKTIKGTSNVMFARKFDINASGTQAHEWFMFHAAIHGVQRATEMALTAWIDTYHGALGIALTDTYTTRLFFHDFNLFFSKLFDGLRQDSGDPLEFAEKAINHYKGKQIILPNRMVPKTLVFSDSIDSHDKIAAIENAIRNRILSMYGIGTWITNDVLGNDGHKVSPINMVIKMTGAKQDVNTRWVRCIKLTDSPDKHTGEPVTIRRYLNEVQNCLM